MDHTATEPSAPDHNVRSQVFVLVGKELAAAHQTDLARIADQQRVFGRSPRRCVEP